MKADRIRTTSARTKQPGKVSYLNLLPQRAVHSVDLDRSCGIGGAVQMSSTREPCNLVRRHRLVQGGAPSTGSNGSHSAFDTYLVLLETAIARVSPRGPVPPPQLRSAWGRGLNPGYFHPNLIAWTCQMSSWFCWGPRGRFMGSSIDLTCIVYNILPCSHPTLISCPSLVSAH